VVSRHKANAILGYSIILAVKSGLFSDHLAQADRADLGAND
jgi:hypothetical protein